jgi:hypothetical protein
MISSFAPMTILLLAATSAAFPSNFIQSSNSTRRSSTFSSQAQYIDVTGTHQYAPPSASDKRGPCPGLNSLANHNFIPHNGIVTYLNAITASNTGADCGFMPGCGLTSDTITFSIRHGCRRSHDRCLTCTMGRRFIVSRSFFLYRRPSSPQFTRRPFRRDPG